MKDYSYEEQAEHSLLNDPVLPAPSVRRETHTCDTCGGRYVSAYSLSVHQRVRAQLEAFGQPHVGLVVDA